MDQGRRGGDGAELEALTEDAAAALGVAAPRVDPPPAPDPGLLAVTDPKSGLALEGGELQLQLARPPLVVRVQERDPLAGRGADAAIAGRAHSPVLLAQVADGREGRAHQLRGAVARAVVHDQDLLRRPGLSEDRAQRPGQQVCPVEGRKDDADAAADHGEGGSRATIRTGPPEPPAIFIGSATTQAPVAGSRSSAATFSSPGTLAAAAIRWTMKSVEGP